MNYSIEPETLNNLISYHVIRILCMTTIMRSRNLIVLIKIILFLMQKGRHKKP